MVYCLEIKKQLTFNYNVIIFYIAERVLKRKSFGLFNVQSSLVGHHDAKGQWSGSATTHQKVRVWCACADVDSQGGGGGPRSWVGGRF